MDAEDQADARHFANYLCVLRPLPDLCRGETASELMNARRLRRMGSAHSGVPTLMKLSELASQSIAVWPGLTRATKDDKYILDRLNVFD